MTEDLNHLSLVHDAVRDMLGERDPVERLRIAVRALSDLGWGHVGFSIPDQDLTILEPQTDGTAFESACQVHAAAAEAWLKRLELEPDGIEQYCLGAGYLFPQDSLSPPVSPGQAAALPTGGDWQRGDVLIIPLGQTADQLTSWISLDSPVNNCRPTPEGMQLAGTLVAQIRAALENNVLRRDLDVITAELGVQIDELVMMQRVDEELNATLNFENVMMLTMDWALRRTGATAGMLNIVTPDGMALSPLAALGYPLDVLSSNPNSPLPFSSGIVGRAARTREIQIVKDVRDDPDYLPLLETTRAELAIPLEMRGRILGVLNLESDEAGAFDDIDLSFIRRLAARAVVALDNARLYRESEQRADEMAALYSASRTISSSLERSDVLVNAAQALAAVLSVSGIVLADFSAEKRQLTITAAYRLGTARNAPDVLPRVGDVLDPQFLPELDVAIKRQRALTVRISDEALSPPLRQFLTDRQIKSLLMTPLTVQDQVLGLVLVVEGRRDRQFTPNEILMAESLASQVASALRQAQLYEDVRELEKLKSEMIRMASHDLRNPLNNTMGYLELLIMALGDSLTEKQMDYVANVRRSTGIMKALIEDLLTLERVESERKSAWIEFDLGELIMDVVEAQRSTADLKQHALSLKVDEGETKIVGNMTQLRQAMTNLIGNGIKYTPDHGYIQVRLKQQDKRVIFEVEDNGYGISPDKQERLFQRFYRAQEPGTDHIPGTGLGLSLVKTVIENHGGEVWVKSEVGVGSTFGFWLPRTDSAREKLSTS